MKTYQALDSKQRSLITVLAENESDARDEIKSQLNRNPSRQPYLTKWLRAGAPVRIKHNITNHEQFKDAYKQCSTYGDWDRLIERMTDPLKRQIHTALQITIATTGATMREDSFVKVLGYSINARNEPADTAHREISESLENLQWALPRIADPKDSNQQEGAWKTAKQAIENIAEFTGAILPDII